MAAATETQAGAACSFGIAGTVSMTGVATFNLRDRSLTDNWKEDRLGSSNGAVVETLVASQRSRVKEMTFIPKGATRAAAQAVADAVMALTPYQVLTIAGSSIAAFNGTYNYMGGGNLKETAEGWCVAGIKLEAFEAAATGGTFAALAVVTES